MSSSNSDKLISDNANAVEQYSIETNKILTQYYKSLEQSFGQILQPSQAEQKKLIDKNTELIKQHTKDQEEIIYYKTEIERLQNENKSLKERLDSIFDIGYEEVSKLLGMS